MNNIEFQPKFHNFSIKNAISRPDLNESLSEFREHGQKCPNSLETPETFNLQIFERFNEISKWKNERIPEIIEVCGELPIVAENYQYAAKVSFYTDRIVPGLHLKSRTSQFGLWNFEKSLKPTEPVCLLTTKKLKGTYRIETYFKDPIYILKPTSLSHLAKRYKTTYQEIISR